MALGFLVGCTATTLPPLPERNPADPQARVPLNVLHNVLGQDETTVAIQGVLSRTEKAAKSSETMQDMDQGNMPGTETKTEAQKKTPSAANVEQEKKAVDAEMKKTADEMKQTSQELKKRSEQPKPQAFYYTCVMHPQVHADKPGKCPICGMTLIKKEGASPK